MDDTDIRGLSAADARAYVLEFMTSLKATERELAALEPELSTWVRRVELAAAKAAVDPAATGLETAARAKLDELAARKATLNTERVELAAKIARMKEKLPLAVASERSVDPDLLLAQLQMAAGQDPDSPPSTLEKDIASLGTDDALAALKRRLAGQGMANPAGDTAGSSAGSAGSAGNAGDTATRTDNPGGTS
jgi:hypothetical protein